MEIKEQLQRILEDVPKVYEAGKSSISQEVSNALKGSASGSIVALKDVSPIEHNLGVKVESKNLMPYPYTDKSKTVGGITFIDNGDGTITANGTATENRLRKSSDAPSSAPSITADAFLVTNAARTNRDAEEKSPGKPIAPKPELNGLPNTPSPDGCSAVKTA